MDLEELRAFLSVIESGSFLGAADALGVPRTTLRRRIASLEARAGVPLLQGSSGRVTPTEAGRILVDRGKSILAEASALLSSIRDVGREPSGTLRVLMPLGLPPYLLTPVFKMVRDQWPGLAIVACPSRAPLAESLLDFDLVVHFGEAGPKGDWISHRVLRTAERLVASEAYVARKGQPRTTDELEAHELFVWEPPDESVSSLPLRAGGELAVQPALVTGDVHFIHQACLAGLGIGFVPDGGFRDPAYPNDRLVPVLDDVIGRERSVRVSIPAATSELPKTKLLLRALQSFVEAFT